MPGAQPEVEEDVTETLPTLPTTLEIDKSGPIRRFSDAAIQANVASALAALPAGKKGAVLAVGNLDGARLAVVARLGEDWSVVLVAEKPWKGGLAAEAAVQFSW